MTDSSLPLTPRTRLVDLLETEGMKDAADRLHLASLVDARTIAREAADEVERRGYRDAQTELLARELRRWANLATE